MEAYTPRKFAVVNMTLDQSIEVESSEISFLTPFTLSHWLDGVIRQDNPYDL